MKRDYLPSKKFMTVVGGGALVVALLWGSYTILSKNKGDTENLDPALAVAEIRKSTEDKDGDGLRDWEEALWDTEVRNPDTDGDGTLDGAEVKSNRDPRRRAPGDTLTAYQKRLVYKIPTKDARANTTERFFNASLPSALVLADRSLDGEEITRADIEKLVDPYVPPESVTIDVYTNESLSIKGDTPEAFEAYANALATLLASYKGLLGGELAIVAETMKTGDINSLLTLRSIAVRYEELSEALVALPVPLSLSDEHLASANAYAGMSGSVLGLSETAADPLKGLVSLREYKAASERADTNLRALLEALGSQAIKAL